MKTTKGRRRARPRLRARRAAGALALLLIVFGAFGGPAGADSALGGYQVGASAAGFAFIYDQPSLPVPQAPKPTFELSVGRTISNSDSGPSGHALASSLWPGSLIANVPPVISDEARQGGAPDSFPTLPGYPVRAESFYPGGPAHQDGGAGPLRMSSSAVDGGTRSSASAGETILPGVLATGSLTSDSSAALDGDRAVSEATATMNGVDILDGSIHIDQLTATATATSDGVRGTVSGAVTISGLSVFGQPGTVDGKGIHFPAPSSSPPGGDGSSPSPGGGGPPGPPAGLPSALPSLPVPGVAPSRAAPAPGAADGPLGEALNPLFRNGVSSVQKGLEQAGIEITLARPIDVVQGPSASRQAGGLVISIAGSTLKPYVEKLPATVKQQFAERGVEFDQTITITLAEVSVSAVATPAYVPPPFNPPPFTGGGSGGGTFPFGPPASFDGGGTTTIPGTPGTGATVPTSASSLGLSALLIGLALGVAVLVAGGLRQVADAATTAPVAVRCPVEEP